MGKKFLRTLLCALLIVSMMHVPAWAETAVVTGNEVNMREGPGTNFRVVDCLPRGAEVTVTDRSNAPWYCVEYDGQTGFMSASFLEVNEEEAPRQTDNDLQSILAQGKEGYVDAMYVRFRSAPGSEYSVLGEYNRGKELLYFFTTGDWAACFIDGRPGYLYADYVALGRFNGWTGAAEEEEEETTPYTYSYGISIPTSAPETRPIAASAELGLEHASTPGVEQTPGYINANYVRFRKGPASSYPIIETYNAGKVVGVTGYYMDWTACLIDGSFGFIYSDYITIPSQEAEESAWGELTEEEVVVETSSVSIPMPEKIFDPTEGYVSGNNVRMRSAPSMSASVVSEVSYGNSLTIVGATNDWAAVIVNKTPGYIYGQYVKVGSLGISTGGGQTVSAGAASLSGNSYDMGVQIAQYAVQFVGTPYSWGGKDPSGFDCSGLVYYVYEQFGITLNRVAQDQAKNGVAVSPEAMQPGDILLFYSGSSYIGHAGIYIGNGYFVHAQNSATGVVITPLEGHYAERGYEVRRIV